MNTKLRVIIALTTLLYAPFSSASFIGDTVNATHVNAFGTPISGSAVVGAGVEFTGSNVIHDYDLDIMADSFSLMVSKDFSAGNFTGVLKELTISGIDSAISAVTFNASASSSLSGGDANSLTFGGGVINVDFDVFTFGSLNTPASALSHTLIWDVTFAAVPEPGILALFAAGLFGLGFARRRKA